MTPTRRTAPRHHHATARPQYQARAYAQAWYAALKTWEVQVVELPSGGGQAQHGPGHSTLGSSGPAVARYLHLPSGRYTEGEVGRAITGMAQAGTPETTQLGRMLERVREGRGPASLVRIEGGWAVPREASIRYGLAVLSLAVRLGDAGAEGPLKEVRGLVANFTVANIGTSE